MKRFNLTTCRHLLLIILSVLISTSCNHTKRSNTTTAEAGKFDINVPAQHKPSSSFSDTFTIDFYAAVFYNPDALQLEKIKAITDTMIFESNMHDCFYQMKNARNVLTKYYPKVKLIEVKNARYLLFKKQDGTDFYIDLNTKDDACGIFLFDGIKTPVMVDMTNIDSELGFYFTK